MPDPTAALSQVYQGQGGTGGAFLTSDDGGSVAAYKHLQDQDLLQKKATKSAGQAQGKSLTDYIVTGYDKHLPYLMEQQQQLLRDYADELKRSPNGIINPVKMVEFSARKAKQQAMVKFSGGMNGTIEEWAKQELALGDKIDPESRKAVDHFVNDLSAEEQMNLGLQGKLPQLKKKEEVFEPEKFIADYATKLKTTKQGGSIMNPDGSITHSETTGYANRKQIYSDVFNDEGGAKLKAQTVTKFNELPATEQKNISAKARTEGLTELQYMVKPQVDKYLTGESNTTLTKPIADKSAYKSAGNGVIKNEDFIWKQSPSEIHLPILIGGTKLKGIEITGSRTNPADNTPLTIPLTSNTKIYDYETGKKITFNPDADPETDPDSIADDKLIFQSYIIGPTGRFVKLTQPKFTIGDKQFPSRTVLIPENEIGDKVFTEMGGMTSQDVESAIKQSGGKSTSTSLKESSSSHSSSMGSAFKGITPR